MSEKKIISFKELLSGPSPIVKMSAEQIIEITTGIIKVFTEDCMNMAEKNWTPNQVKQLKWLFEAVLSGKEYASYAAEQIKEADNGKSNDM